MAALHLAVCLGSTVDLLDEPLHYTAAMLINRGAEVFVDFHSIYPPLGYLPTALAFSALGETAFAARLGQGLIYAGLVVCLGLLFRREGAKGWGLWLMVFALVAVTGPLVRLVSLLGVALALLSVIGYMLAQGASTPRHRTALLALSGVCAGIGLMVRVNFGLFAIAVFVGDQLTTLVRDRRSEALNLRRVLVRSFLPFVLPVGTVVVWFVATYRGHVGDAATQFVKAPNLTAAAYAIRAYSVADFPGVKFFAKLLCLTVPVFPLLWVASRSTNPRAASFWWVFACGLFGSELWLGYEMPVALPILVAVIILPVLANQATSSGALDRREFIPLLACATFSHYYLCRPDLPHLFPAAAPLTLLLPQALFARTTGAPFSPMPSRWLLWGTVVALAGPALWYDRPRSGTINVAVSMLRGGLVRVSDAARIGTSAPPLLPPLSGLYPDPDEHNVVRFVRARTREDEPVYVGLADHSNPFLSDNRLNWILGRPLGARQYLLQSALSNTVEVEDGTIADLQSRHVRWLVLWNGIKGGEEMLGMLGRLEPGATQLDIYIKSRYHAVAVFGGFVVYLANQTDNSPEKAKAF